MVIHLMSDWMIPTVETLKILNNLSDEKYNEELESYQYTDRNQEKTLLVITNEKGKIGDINISVAQRIKSLLDDTKFTEVFVFGETQTASAYALLKNNEKATIYTSNRRIQLNTEEILEAFYRLSGSLCESICVVNPVQRSACKATRKGAETCAVRTHIDNAKFHARMGWKDQLLQAFTSLMQYIQEQQVRELR